VLKKTYIVDGNKPDYFWGIVQVLTQKVQDAPNIHLQYYCTSTFSEKVSISTKNIEFRLIS
jgi:hypothetical protein